MALPDPVAKIASRIRKLSVRSILAVSLALVVGAALRHIRADHARPAQKAISSSDNLRLAGRYRLSFAEPSGLSLAADKKSLWAVSDADGCAYQISLEGKVLRTIDLHMNDLEGVAVLDENTLAVVAERGRKIVEMRLDGTVVREGILDIPGIGNSGPEAVACDAESGDFYILNEFPGTLLVLDRNLKEKFRKKMTFARDYSSIEYEPVRRHLWVLSDLSQAFYVLDAELNLQAVFSTSIVQQEGLAVDYESRRVYIVSDRAQELYVFEFNDY